MIQAVANLSITENEVDLDSVHVESPGPNFSLCLIGTLLIRRPYNFPTFATHMADLWQPGQGVAIIQLENRLILCRFRHMFDLRRVLSEGPWHFDMSLLVLHELKPDKDPQTVSLRSANFWIQIHDVPAHFYSRAVGWLIGDAIGQFVSYNDEFTYDIMDPVMRLKIPLDVLQPLKIERKLKKPDFETAVCPLTYEKLPNFCSICGHLGHIDHQCEVHFQVPEAEILRAWDKSIRALPRRRRLPATSPYLIPYDESSSASSLQRACVMPVHPSALLPPNILELQKAFGACPQTIGIPVAFCPTAVEAANAAIHIPDNKRHREKDISLADHMIVDHIKRAASPTKQQVASHQVSQNKVLAGRRTDELNLERSDKAGRPGATCLRE
ncbi:hypothetical protein LINGRAHAP2_LOCUS22534 [Linum grandiflorum]